MSTIIFLLVFYYVFSALVILGALGSDTEFKWYEKIGLSLLGFLLFPILIGEVKFPKK